MVSEAEQIKKIKAEAKEHFEAIRLAQESNSRSSMVIGFHAYRMKINKLFQVIGFETEDDARKAAGVGESTWYANIRLAEQFKELPEKQFVSMKQANAKALADLPESKRLSTEWIRMAAVEKIEIFAEKCDHEMNGKARASDTKERSTTLKEVSVPASRKTVIVQKAKLYAEQHGIEPDTGKAIEMALIEATDGMTLINAITNALKRVKTCKDIIFGEYSAAEALTKVDEELDAMVLDFDAALLNKENEVVEEVPG
jgi:hypothetical protein